MKKVYNSIADNWSLIKDKKERQILDDYSKNCIILTKGYIIYMIMTGMFVILIPLTPILLNVILPITNVTRQPGFIFRGVFPVDDIRDYYLEIFAFDVVGCCNSVLILITMDSMYACCTEHCIALLAIIRYRLKLCTKYTHIHSRDVAYELIVEIVKLHNKAIDLTGLLEESYSLSFFILIGMNMLYCSFISVLIILSTNDIMELIRFGCVLSGLVVHLFYISFPGQKLIDYSTGLFNDTYVNEWYEISSKSQNLLRFMRLRCLKPFQLTAGGIYIMNLENFAMIIKTSISYITVFASFT